MKRRNTAISVFVVAWTLFFQYQTLRLSYLSPWARRIFQTELPHIPLLFPPAGWIMFYHLDRSYGFAEVYRIEADQRLVLVDPHDIFRTKAVGYDNIRRNVLISVLSRDTAQPFCRYLLWKFLSAPGFAIVYGEYPDVAGQPDFVKRQVAYRCAR